MTKRTIIFILLAALTLGIALPTSASTDAAGEIPCTITVPQGREAAVDHLRDDDYRTRFTLAAGQTLTVEWTEEAGGVLLEWFDVNYHTEIILYDEAGQVVHRESNSTVPYRMYLPAAGARKMTVKAIRSMASLCEVKVLPVGETPVNCATTGKVDLMLILSGVSDELDMMGGLLPLYAGEHGIKTALVYMGRDDGNQVQEAFRALEAMGLDVVTVFMQKEDHLTYNRGRMASYWKEDSLKTELVTLLRTYGPKVVVTVDPEDSSPMVRTAYTGWLINSVVTKAVKSKKTDVPVQKLYHLSQEGTTVVEEIRHIKRGYDDLTGCLARLGTQIRETEI